MLNDYCSSNVQNEFQHRIYCHGEGGVMHTLDYNESFSDIPIQIIEKSETGEIAVFQITQKPRSAKLPLFE